LINSDVTAAGFWITNPNNIFRRNHVANADWFGYWIKGNSYTDGESANPNICPVGITFGEFKDNVAHSNERYGFRITNYMPRTYPCKKTYDPTNPANPYLTNPPVEALIENFVTWKNGDNGV